jgi:hypothetical protein
MGHLNAVWFDTHVNPDMPSGNYIPPALTNSNSAIRPQSVGPIYWFCVFLSINSDYFLKRH